MGVNEIATGSSSDPEFIRLSFQHEDSEASALKLVFQLRPEWQSHDPIDIVKFTDGITNTVRLKQTLIQSPLTYKPEVVQDLEKVPWLVK